MIQYKVKIHPSKSPVYIWGSEEVQKPFNGSLTLVIRNDEVGETVLIKTLDERSETHKPVAELRPGEVYALQLGTKTGHKHAIVGSIIGISVGLWITSLVLGTATATRALGMIELTLGILAFMVIAALIGACVCLVFKPESIKGVLASCKEDNVDSKVECTIITSSSN